MLFLLFINFFAVIFVRSFVVVFFGRVRKIVLFSRLAKFHFLGWLAGMFYVNVCMLLVNAYVLCTAMYSEDGCMQNQ